mmetsp:Transcript_137140/g.273573  ORF Transcript_137140/g.273573 Transcript_137140/m.273573 type:complete len:186 (+) Transcript_137140:60-617(+)
MGRLWLLTAGAVLYVAIPASGRTTVAQRLHLAARRTSSAADDSSVTDIVSGNVDTQQILQDTANSTAKLRRSMKVILGKSTEGMKSLKTLLTTNAKGTKALNDMLMEMGRLTERMDAFGGNMERCRKKIISLEEKDAEILTPSEADDPLLGATSLLQLHKHAEKLQSHVGMAHRILQSNGQQLQA